MKTFQVTYVDVNGVKSKKAFTAVDENDVYQQLEAFNATRDFFCGGGGRAGVSNR